MPLASRGMPYARSSLLTASSLSSFCSRRYRGGSFSETYARPSRGTTYLGRRGRPKKPTGAMLKRPKKVPVLFGYLPPVYYPSFCLNYFRITDEAGRVAVHYERIEKEPSPELTWEQRLLTLTKRKTNEGVLIPSKTLLGTQ